MLLSHHFINPIRHSYMHQPLKGHIQGVCLMYFSTKFNKMSHFVELDAILLECIAYKHLHL